MTIEEMRAEYPCLDTGLIYLNHAATGPLPRAAGRMVAEHVDARMRGEIDNFERTMRVMTEARAMVAAMLGSDSGRIAFCLNTSEGLNILAGGLDWRPGDRVLIVDREFPSNVHPWLNLRRLGVEIDVVPQVDGVVRTGDIARGITPRTRLVAVSWVQFLSGYRVDLDEVGALCRGLGVLLSVDAIQGLGAVRLDLEVTPVDFLASGVAKWQCGPQGMAFIHVSEELQARLAQHSRGWLSVAVPWDFFAYEQDLAADARRYENGTPSSLGLNAYHGALTTFARVGYERIDALVRGNCSHLYAGLAALGCDILTPADPARRAGMVTFRHERAEEMQRTLAERRMIVSARAGHVRISPHYYNTYDEIDAVLAVIGELLHT
jgi:cysteine desulfurase / selenocysteine lyase